MLVNTKAWTIQLQKNVLRTKLKRIDETLIKKWKRMQKFWLLSHLRLKSELGWDLVKSTWSFMLYLLIFLFYIDGLIWTKCKWF